MGIRTSWSKWVIGGVLAGAVTGTVYWQRSGPLAPAVAAPAPPQAAGQAPATPPAPTAPSESSQWVVAYIHGNVAVTREMLGEYLIARMGADRLENFVNQQIIEHECRKQGVGVSAAEVESAFREDLQRLRLTRKEFVSRVLAQRRKTLNEYVEDTIRPHLLMTRLCQGRVQVTEDDVRKAYEARYGEKVDCQIIFWSTDKDHKSKEDVQAIHARIRDDAEAFDRMARDQEIPNLAATAGKITPFGRYTTDDPNLEDTAFRLKPGEVSPLIKGKEGGWLVVKCHGRVPPPKDVEPVENLKAALEKEVFEKKLQEEMKKAFPEMQKRARPELLLKKGQESPHLLAPEIQLISAQVAGGTNAVRPSSDYSRRVVAYIHGDVRITREMLGEYLIARFGAQRLDALLYKLIIEYECRRQGIEVTPEEVEVALQKTLQEQKLTLSQFEERLRQDYRATLYEWKEDTIRSRLLFNKLFRDKVHASEEEIRKAYEAHYGEKVECQIILWPKEEQKRVTMMYATLRDKPDEFEKAAAMQASPTLARSKGRISPIGRYSTGNAEMEKAAFALKPGELSHVMGVPEGLLVMKCLGRVPATNTPLEEVRASLEREVIEKKMVLEIPKLAAELQKAAKPVKILKDYEDTTQVIRDVEAEIEQAKGKDGAGRSPK